MSQRICDEPGCGKPHRARGLCSAHWKRKYTPVRAYRQVPCYVCGVPTLKTSGRSRTVCSTTCRWYLQFDLSINVWFPTCEWCNELFTSQTAEARWCSSSCQAAAIRKTWPTCPVIYCTCAECGALFVNPHEHPTCSVGCADARAKSLKRDAKHRRRVLERGAFVESVSRRYIHERDRWTCHLCGEPVDREAVVPAALAPTLDHVIPLAAGGTHERANVRTAHYRCNAIKGDGYMVGGEQLMLIG